MKTFIERSNKVSEIKQQQPLYSHTKEVVTRESRAGWEKWFQGVVVWMWLDFF